MAECKQYDQLRNAKCNAFCRCGLCVMCRKHETYKLYDFQAAGQRLEVGQINMWPSFERSHVMTVTVLLAWVVLIRAVLCDPISRSRRRVLYHQQNHHFEIN